MTTIQTTGRITDTVELVNADGEKLNISFTFLPSGALVRQLRAMELALADAKNKPAEEAASKVGTIILSLFKMLFGAENTEKIVEFYGGQYEFMVYDFMPYIYENVIPKCNAAVRQAKKRAKYGLRR